MYKKSKAFRKTIDKLIQMGERVGYADLSDIDLKYDFSFNTREETSDTDIYKKKVPVESYILSNRLSKIKYEIFGYRTNDFKFIIVELNKWSSGGNIFLLNNEANKEKGLKILKEIEEIANELYNSAI